MMFVSHRVTLASPTPNCDRSWLRPFSNDKVMYKLKAFNVRHQLLFLNQDPMRMKMVLGMSRLQIIRYGRWQRATRTYKTVKDFSDLLRFDWRMQQKICIYQYAMPISCHFYSLSLSSLSYTNPTTDSSASSTSILFLTISCQKTARHVSPPPRAWINSHAVLSRNSNLRSTISKILVSHFVNVQNSSSWCPYDELFRLV